MQNYSRHGVASSFCLSQFIRENFQSFDILLTVHLGIILAIDQPSAQILVL